MISKDIEKSIIEDLKEIDEYGKYKYSKLYISKKYNVSRPTVYRIYNKMNLGRNRSTMLTETFDNIIKDLQDINDYNLYKYTYQDIADKYNLSRGYIGLIVKQYGLKRGGKCVISKVKKFIIKDLKELDENGNHKYSKTEIAKKYNISRYSVHKISKEI